MMKEFQRHFTGLFLMICWPIIGMCIVSMYGAIQLLYWAPILVMGLFVGIVSFSDSVNLEREAKKRNGEYIICSAIWYKEIPLKKEIRGRLPKNCDRGVVVCGHRHGQCMWTMGSLTGLRSVTNAEDGVGDYEQGFLTSKNRFVERMEALEIARKANQVLDEKEVRTHIGLHSEDIY